MLRVEFEDVEAVVCFDDGLGCLGSGHVEYFLGHWLFVVHEGEVRQKIYLEETVAEHIDELFFEPWHFQL